MTDIGAILESQPVRDERERRVRINPNESRENFDRAVNSERFIMLVANALRDRVTVDYLLEKFPYQANSCNLSGLYDEFRVKPQRDLSWKSGLPRQSSEEIKLERTLEDLSRLVHPQQFSKYVSEESKKRARQMVREIVDGMDRVDNGRVVIQVNPDKILDILRSGEYRPTLDELGDSGRLDPKVKTLIEELNRGIDFVDLDLRGVSPIDRRRVREISLGTFREGKHPVYGHLVLESTPEEIGKSAGYGESCLVLKPLVGTRSVFILGDSLNNININVELNIEDATRMRLLLDKLGEDKRVDWRVLPPYIEVQIIGGVRLDDIEAVVVDGRRQKLSELLLLSEEKIK